MPSGNPFEASILVKCCRNQKVVHSFFIHELAPNSTIGQLHARIVEQQHLVPFPNWVLTKRTRAGKQRSLKVLKHQLSFADYGISSWDCVYVVPRAESPECIVPRAARACGSLVHSVASLGRSYKARLGSLSQIKRSEAATSHQQQQCKRAAITRSSSLLSMCTCDSFSTNSETVSSNNTLLTI
ncbi:hypothetical protein GGF42_000651 [Coemansia sp. RSA 2424]|nr:hypothetical protein GGF42_000651 [Coemansia sp. RSA 2424]